MNLRVPPATVKRAAFALVTVLTFIALLTVLLVAYFSRSINEQQISICGGAQTRVTHLAQGAIDIIEGELKQEIAAGSKIEWQNNVPIYSPASNRTIVPAVAYSADETISPPINIIKRSAFAVPFFPKNASYNSDTYKASSLASPCGTDLAAQNGRSITKQRWNAPYLLDPSLTGSSAPTNSFLSPDWIIVTRSGPKSFTTWDDNLKNGAPSNMDFAVGRFAYIIYDEGGLLDINVAGNSLGSSENGRRGRLNQADLKQIPPLSNTDISSFLKWRSALTGTNTSATPHKGGLFDPARDFIRVQNNGTASDQTFINRHDLITYAKQHPDQLGQDLTSLQYLGTFSREFNAPSFAPAFPTGSTINYPNSINPALANIRFTAPGTLADGTVVTAGMPFLRKRFSLSRLGWITAKGPSANLPANDPAYNADGTDDHIMLYFGLQATGAGAYKSWIYRPSGGVPASRILPLDEVAAIPRDPDFFELLKAAILQGSLGQHYDGDSATNSSNRDSNTDTHIMQIGANLIDQYDSDDFPTIISFTNTAITDHSAPEYCTNNIRGVENLPYLHELAFYPFRWELGLNAGDKTRPNISLFLVPRIWNPHQDIRTPNSDIQLRFVANSGTCIFSTGTSVTTGSSTVVTSKSSYIKFSDTVHQFTFSNRSAYLDPAPINPADVITSSAAVTLFNNFSSTAVPSSGPYGVYFAAGTPLNCVALNLGSRNVPDNRLGASGTGTPPNMTAVNITGTTVFEMQYSADGNTFYPYQRFEVNYLGGDPRPYCGGMSRVDTSVNNTAYVSSGGHSNISSINILPSIQTVRSLDPRSRRLGMGLVNGPTGNLSPWWGPTSVTSGVLLNPGGCWYSRPYGSLFVPSNVPSDLSDTTHRYFSGYYSVNSNRLISTGNFSTYYFDQDSILRRADGDNDNDVHPTYSVGSSNPTTPGSAAVGRDAPRIEDRPLVLNRPFRSVGEMGYAFRDTPWKTLDFFSSNSGDAGLLDVFSIDDNEIVAGRVNLNTRQPAVLQTLLSGALKSEYSDLVSNNRADITTSMASQIASFTTQWTSSMDTSKGPLLNRSEIATKIVSDSSFPVSSKSDYIKTRREATVRALVEAGQTRTWNLLIDVVAQTGRFPANMNSKTDHPLSRFIVDGECRYWVHLALDRFTGEIIDTMWEPAYE